MREDGFSFVDGGEVSETHLKQTEQLFLSHGIEGIEDGLGVCWCTSLFALMNGSCHHDPNRLHDGESVRVSRTLPARHCRCQDAAADPLVEQRR